MSIRRLAKKNGLSPWEGCQSTFFIEFGFRSWRLKKFSIFDWKKRSGKFKSPRKSPQATEFMYNWVPPLFERSSPFLPKKAISKESVVTVYFCPFFFIKDLRLNFHFQPVESATDLFFRGCIIYFFSPRSKKLCPSLSHFFLLFGKACSILPHSAVSSCNMGCQKTLVGR